MYKYASHTEDMWHTVMFTRIHSCTAVTQQKQFSNDYIKLGKGREETNQRS